ncbi:MAG TPA: FlgD immunoglobulin-like domain containing protein [Candidatus Eisenbacteria bacterium]|nr:FlgD immunoglobulin-like domain containing protein [Candidatus Eisenbacteria bacterium]
MEASPRGVAVLAQNTPNPFNPRTTIRFMVPKAGPGSLTIYDVNGRRVATPLQGELTEGEHRVAWEAKDHAGRPLPSGVYLYRLELPGFESTRRMTLLR